jgi:hypothetical protein
LGEEAAPAEGSATAREHHVSLDVAHAFARYVRATGDREYARTRAWPVVRDVADWVVSRAEETPRGFEIRHVTGVAEKEKTEDNAAFVNIGAIAVLQDALELAQLVEAVPGRRWAEVANRLVVPVDRRSGIIRNYDGHRRTEEKGATPDAAAALFLFDYDAGARSQEATLQRAVDLSPNYVGSPMLSSLLGLFAARLGQRKEALELFERGYGDFILQPFSITDEYSAAVFPDQPRAGPFTANLGGFLSVLLFGLTGIRLGSGEPEGWCRHPPLLPAGWGGIEIDRVWIRGEPMRLHARHGDDRAMLKPA